MMTGVPSKEVEETVTEISKRELIAVAPLLAIMIVLGFVPQVALNVINPAVEQVQKYVGVTDPEAAVLIEESGS
jgi:NADH-quinone oxidoreductase subunit M